MASAAADETPQASESASNPTASAEENDKTEAPQPGMSQSETETKLDPLAQISSMWSGWLSPPSDTDATRTATDATRAASEWWQGAGKMVETAMRDVSTKISEASKSIDTAAVNEQVNVIRERSGKFVEDVSKSMQNINLNIDQSELQKRAEVISSSTRELFDKASQSLQQGHQEALEIFVDESPNQASEAVSVAPWDTSALPEGERKYADTLRQEMLKIVVDAIYSKRKRTELFLSDAAQSQGFSFELAKNEGMARAALDADKNMRRLRAGLVPGKMNENAFWTVYFFHVHRVRQTLVANEGVMPAQQTDDEDDDPAALFGDDDEDEELAALDAPPKTKPSPAPPDNTSSTTPDGNRNWDDEIDAIFDDQDNE